MSANDMTDILIIGAGPAGLTAAIYALRQGKNVTVLEKNSFGGQINLSPRIENYPGYESVSGSELADKLVSQVIGLGGDLQPLCATAIKSENGCFVVETDDGCINSRSVIVAAGAEHRHLGVEGEEEYIGKGVSYCAVCDGPFCKGKDVILIGGGNSAVVEALMLAKYCSSVTMLQNLPYLTAEKAKADEVYSTENIKILTGVEVLKFSGNGQSLDSVTVRLDDGKETVFKTGYAFVSVGFVPVLGAFSDVIDLDSNGYADSGESCTTVTPGVYVAGDCRKKSLRQIVTAVSDGASAAIEACKFIG